jgi:hypothetical protein
MELWKDIPEYEGLYQVSSLGRVRGFAWKQEWTILKQCNTNKGYLEIQLTKESKRKHWKIHRLVGLAFIPNPDNLSEIDHINRNKLDNSISNLRWISRSDNCINKTHKVANSGERYIQKHNRLESYCFRIFRRVDGISRQLINRSFPTLQEAVEFRNNYLRK